MDEAGARVRQWTWSSLTHTPLRPVFLSLNRTLGVRVLGPKQVFVTFLAQGKQAKFSVGACCDQIEVVFFFFCKFSKYLPNIYLNK